MPNDIEILAAGRPGHGLRSLWQLEQGCHYLNHGSFGATPRHVLAAQNVWRSRMEKQPVRFMVAELPEALRKAAARLAAFLGSRAERLAFVENASDAINAVLRSIPWRRGDVIVLANHAYPAVRNTVSFLAQRHALQVTLAQIDFPFPTTDDLVQAYCAAITPGTRLAIVDHVFSPLSVVTPVHHIIEHCKRLGVPVLIDGAHGPGMLALALETLGADWYVGNCHKWLFASKGVAFLYAASAVATDLHPSVISNFYPAGFPNEFDWQGTRDYSGWLAVTAALDFLETFGVQRYQQLLREQAQLVASMLCASWHVNLPAPAEAFAAMVTLPLPWPGDATLEDARRWHDRLWREHRVEVPVLVINDQLWVRISAQIYNELSDYEVLARAFS